MNFMRNIMMVAVMSVATQSQAIDLPELNQQTLAVTLGAISFVATAYKQLSKFLASPDAKQMKYQPYIQAFLDDSGMVTDKEFQEAVDKQNAQLDVIKAAVNLLADGKNNEARTLLQAAAKTTPTV